MNKKHYEDLFIEMFNLSDSDVLSISSDNKFDNDMPATGLGW